MTTVIQALQGSLESTINSVTTNTDLINVMSNTVSNLDVRIGSLDGAIRNSQVNFAVERSGAWPFDQIVTYAWKLSDSHNAISVETGMFSAPIAGTYIFFFFAHIECAKQDRFLFAMKNQDKFQIFRCYSDEYVGASRTIVFTLQLNAGDQVGINSGSSLIYDYQKFYGFLLPSFWSAQYPAQHRWNDRIKTNILASAEAKKNKTFHLIQYWVFFPSKFSIYPSHVRHISIKISCSDPQCAIWLFRNHKVSFYLCNLAKFCGLISP